MRYKFITVEGNIGSGKTSLATKLSQDLSGKLILEEFADNPFLPKFYNNPAKYAFPLELFFMAERYKQLQQSLPSPELFRTFTISDYLFIKSLLFAMVNLPADEYRLYTTLFNIINPTLPQPDLLVYLHAPIERLQQNIKKRGRSFETNITDDYLQSIQDMYFNYFKKQAKLKILVIDVSTADFVANHDEYQAILKHMDQDYDEGLHFLHL